MLWHRAVHLLLVIAQIFCPSKFSLITVNITVHIHIPCFVTKCLFSPRLTLYSKLLCFLSIMGLIGIFILCQFISIEDDQHAFTYRSFFCMLTVSCSFTESQCCTPISIDISPFFIYFFAIVLILGINTCMKCALYSACTRC